MSRRKVDPPVTLAMRRAEAAAAVGVSLEHFDAEVRPFIPCVRLGGVVVYRVADLDAFMAARASSPIADLDDRRRVA